MRIAVCDDEEIFLNQMSELLKRMPDIESVACYNDIEQMYDQIKENVKYDIVFMDIEWNKECENGILYAGKINEISNSTQIIYVTAYNDRFSESIFFEQVNLCGYLVKPVKEENLLKLIRKAKARIESQKSETLLLRKNGTVENIAFSTIMYIESKAHQLYVHTMSETHCIYGKLDEYDKQMRTCFLRCHKSYLVNMNFIRRIDKKEITLKNGAVLPVSKAQSTYTKETYFRFMGENL